MSSEETYEHTAKQISLAILPKLSGGLSFVGSLFIFQDVIRHKTRRSKPYHRLVFGMSTFDMIASLMNVMSTWPIPEGTSNVYGASGSTQTCTAQGFFSELGNVVTPVYNASLCVFFMLTIRKNWRDKQLLQIEPILHSIPILLGLTMSILGLPFDLYSPSGWLCWIAPFPADCLFDDLVECERGELSSLFRWIHYGIIWSAILFVSIGMSLIYYTVWRQESKTRKYTNPSRESISVVESSLNTNHQNGNNNNNNNDNRKRPSVTFEDIRVNANDGADDPQSSEFVITTTEEFRQFVNYNNNSSTISAPSEEEREGVEQPPASASSVSVQPNHNDEGKEDGEEIDLIALREEEDCEGTTSSSPPNSKKDFQGQQHDGESNNSLVPTDAGSVRKSESTSSSFGNLEEYDMPVVFDRDCQDDEEAEKGKQHHHWGDNDDDNDDDDEDQNSTASSADGSRMVQRSSILSRQSTTSNTSSMTQNTRRSRQRQQQISRSRQVATQAMLFVGALYLTWIFTTLTRIFQILHGTTYYPLLVLMAIFFPLQGFFNAIIYLRPRYLKLRKEQQMQQLSLSSNTDGDDENNRIQSQGCFSICWAVLFQGAGTADDDHRIRRSTTTGGSNSNNNRRRGVVSNMLISRISLIHSSSPATTSEEQF